MAVTPSASTSDIPSVPRPRVKLQFLDGFRGLAALYVLLFHLYNSAGLPHALALSLSWLRFGHYAVSVFIVLSGYCLMLPVVRSEKAPMPGGTLSFFQRRARRILPPYYAALILSLLFMLIGRRIEQVLSVPSTDARWAENFTLGCILSHVFLVHNWFKDWWGSIDGPMWSVATEWQIYFLFPLLLLPVWRKFGNVSVVLVGLVLGVMPLLVLPNDYNFQWARPQYIGLFAMGMVGSAIGFSERARDNHWRDTLPWGTLSALGFLAFFSVAFYALIFEHRGLTSFGLPVSQPWCVDVLVGLSTVCLIVFCANHTQETLPRPKPMILRLFESPWAVGLGAFSYSIYLMHSPILSLMDITLSAFVSSQMVVKSVLLVVGVPVILGLSYLFHLAFERRFMSAAARKRAADEIQHFAAANQ